MREAVSASTSTTSRCIPSPTTAASVSSRATFRRPSATTPKRSACPCTRPLADATGSGHCRDREGTGPVKLAVIPARGGSKRIPRKNVRPFCGKPMIAWSIEAAWQAAASIGSWSPPTTTTSPTSLAPWGRSALPCGPRATCRRPRRNSASVARHAIQWFGSNDPPSEVCCIYATAPFLTVADLTQGLLVLEELGCDFVFSV